jgi:transglutaminase-like putative cysteine protease
MARYRVVHITTYRYGEQVSVSHNQLHLAPGSNGRQRCEDFVLEISPRPAVIHRRDDWFGNRVDSFTVQDPHRELVVKATSTVEVEPSFGLDPSVTPPWEEVRDALSLPRGDDVAASEFACPSPLVPSDARYATWAAADFTAYRPLLDAALALTMRIHREFTYDAEATAVDTPLAEAFASRRGVCQDFAHLGIACLRSLGLAARYVSGYLETDPPPGQAKLVGADASHAWLSLYCPGIGWIGLDPTNGCVVGDRHLIVAIGRDFSDVSPVRGVILGGGAHQVAVSVDVARV